MAGLIERMVVLAERMVILKSHFVRNLMSQIWKDVFSVDTLEENFDVADEITYKSFFYLLVF